MPRKKDKKINPESFYKGIEGIYTKSPSKKKMEVSDKVMELPKLPDNISVNEQQPFDSEVYKEKANKELEENRSNIRVYNKNRVNTLLFVLIGVIVIFGLFFVWSVSNDKFKTDFDCPDCNCEQPDLYCPTVSIPDCICNQTLTCPSLNNSLILDAINNISLNSSN